MKILVINCGSSSLKYQVLDMSGEILLAKGLVERIGMEGVLTAVKNVLDVISEEVLGFEANEQRAVDLAMIELDGTPKTTDRKSVV